MFNLLRRSKNRRSQHHQQDSEDLENSTVSQQLLQQSSISPTISFLGQKPKPPQRRMHGKFTTSSPAIDGLEEFNHLENELNGTNLKALQEKPATVSDEREAKFAKIYFEDTEPIRNVNLATTTKTAPTTLAAGTKSLTYDGGRSSDGARDVLNSTARRSLGFRKVDLDGVNSVIEAILPTNDAAYGESSKECSSDHHRHHNDHQQIQTDISDERLNVNRRTHQLSQNERAELSGHVSSQPQLQPCGRSTADDHILLVKNIETIDQADANVTKFAKAFNKRESLAANSLLAGNVDSQRIDQNTEKKEFTKTFAQIATAIDAEQSNSKQIKAARRRSYFSKKIHNEISTPTVTEASTTPTAQQEQQQQQAEKKSSQGPLQKGKKLFADIFMARGRHHANQRNNKQNQSATKQEPCTNSTTATTNTISNSNSPNTHNKNCNAAVNSTQKICQNAINNKDITTISQTRNNFTTDINDRAAAPTTMLRQHLETSNSAGRCRDPTILSTNQMIFSNNSAQKNVSSRRDDSSSKVAEAKVWPRSLMRGNGLQHQRSNSAEHQRERREPENSIKAAASRYERAFSEEPPHTERRRWSGALRDFVRSTPLTSSSGGAAKLPQQPSVIRSGISERNSAIDAHDIVVGKQVTRNSTDKQQLSATNSVRQDERGSASKLTTEECARDRLKSWENNQKQTTKSPMGQTYGKNESSAEESRASTPREFRESQIPEVDFNARLTVPLPKITVSDCSSAADSSKLNSGSTNGNPNAAVEHEIFYEFESENLPSVQSSNVNSVQIEDLDDSDIDDEVFHEQVFNSQPTQYTNYRHHSPLHRHSPITLADVPEQEEDENSAAEAVSKAPQRHHNVNDIDNELLRRSSSRHANSASVSPERGPLKSCDSNLSNSYPDSGISGCSDSHFSDAPESNLTTNKSKSPSPARSTLPPQLQQQTAHQQQQQHRRQRSPFVRDSTSTDCDDTLLQCDDLDCFASPTISTTTVIAAGIEERLVCIESISLPDVVESTTSSSPGSVGNGAANSSLDGINGGEQIVNINGATGNSIGNVHFIPIHIEGAAGERGSKSRSSSPNQQQKRRSIDDSVIGSGGMKGNRWNANFNNQPTIEIVEEDEINLGFKTNNASNDDKIKSENLRLELQEQKSRFAAQLDDAHKNVQNLHTKITEMQTKIANLEQELSTKTWNVERLQSELNASQREDDFVRKKLRLLEQEKTGLRQKFNENEDEFKRKYDELETEYTDLQEKYKNSQKLASELQLQLARAQSEAEKWRTEVEKIRADLEEQVRILTNSLENSEAERKICEDKWQKEFEMLRTQHMDREETLMTDCEWQLRQMQKQWKDKLDKSEHARRDAVDTAELMGLELEARKQEIERLREYESEVKSLRGVVSEQHSSIQSLMDQIESLKAELSMANEKLEDQIEAVKKIKYQCDNALCDKNRQMIYRIDEVRNEAASFWENRLLTEMTRLTHELESVHVDERREALDKLQAEHVEELRALTTRYTANEEELRTELAELHERYSAKCQEFLDLRQKSDNAILQTRMHLDRADREYQNAMCREEERREALEETLRKEFEEEKEKMEAKFRDRLDQVKSEFMKELESSKQEMTKKHQKDLEQQKSKLKAERDEAMQELAERHRAKLSAAEDQIKETELRHQRDLNELKATYDEDKAVLDKRDMSNANEIEQLHRRCRCLTNLFEEMRMRYERRDPRPEDLREIEELRTRCDSQERDLFTLTTTLREMQMQVSNSQPNDKSKKGGKSIHKPPPKTIPTSCDVIYEENEERDSPPPPEPLKSQNLPNGNADSEESEEDAENGDEVDDDENEEDADNDENSSEEENASASKASFNGGNKMVNGSVSEVH